MNFETEGNLASQRETPLKSVSEITSKDSPVDLFALAKKLAEAGEYDDASKAFFLASAYIEFDSQRVLDKTAHQAGQVLMMESKPHISEQENQKFMETLEALPNKAIELSEFMQKVGAPSYKPTYMIEHGIKAFGSLDGDGLDPNFDGNKVWLDMISTVKSGN